MKSLLLASHQPSGPEESVDLTEQDFGRGRHGILIQEIYPDDGELPAFFRISPHDITAP